MLIAGQEGAVEGINQSIVDEEVLGEDVEDGGGFGEDEEDCGDDGERAVEDGEDGGLRDVGYGEHEDCDADAEGEGGEELVGEGAPEFAVSEEVGDALDIISCGS